MRLTPQPTLLTCQVTGAQELLLSCREDNGNAFLLNVYVCKTLKGGHTKGRSQGPYLFPAVVQWSETKSIMFWPAIYS